MERNIELVNVKPIFIIKVNNNLISTHDMNLIGENLKKELEKDYYVLVIGLEQEEQISFDLLNCENIDETFFSDVETMVKKILNK